MEVGNNDNDEVLSLLQEEGYSLEGDEATGNQDVYAHLIEDGSAAEQPKAEGETPSSEEGSEAASPEGETPEGHQQEPTSEEPNAEERVSADEEYNRLIGEMSNGLYNSVDDLRNNEVFQKAQEYDDVVEELQSLRDQLNEVESREPEFVNDFIKNLNEYVKSGGNPEEYVKIQGVNVEEMDPIDVLKTQMKWDNPDLSDEDVSLLLNEKYKLDEDSFTEEEMRLGKVQMKIDSKQAREKLREHQHDMSVPSSGQSEEEIQEANDLRMAEWDDAIVDLTEEFESISIPVNNDLTLNYKVSPEEKEALENEVYEIIELTGMNMDGKESIQAAKEIMRNRYIINHFNDIAKALGEKARSMTDEEWHKQAHNPSAIPKSDTPDEPEKPKTVGDVAWDVISKAEGLG